MSYVVSHNLSYGTRSYADLADGRLPSAGTRTVRLNGRARRITFHVFHPKVVEDILDRGVVDEWRDEDAIAKAEKQAAGCISGEADPIAERG